MEVRFCDQELQRIEADLTFAGGYPPEAIRGFRKVMQAVRAATDERDLRTMRSLNFEKLKGDRSHECSMRLNKQWRLVFEVVSGTPKNILAIKSIEDYH
jgi:proteic killer suppression protein